MLSSKPMKRNYYKILISIGISIMLIALCALTAIIDSQFAAFADGGEDGFSEELQASESTQQLTGSDADIVVANSVDKGEFYYVITGSPNDISSEDATVETILRSQLSSFKYIPNAYYFLLNPKHYENNTDIYALGVCTTVALQLLMGYHNYYSDRRIIPQEFLRYNHGNYSGDPILERDYAAGQGCERIGTEDEFFDELFNLSPASTDFMFAQSISNVKDAGLAFMEEHTPANVRNNISLTSGTLTGHTVPIAEIDAGRPIVLGMSPLRGSGSKFHVVVAYGYAWYNNVFGYIVHYGWGDTVIEAWAPASWFGYYIKMDVNTHDHNFVPHGIYITNYERIQCSTCGVKRLDIVYEISGSTITNVKYPENGHLSVLSEINIYNTELAIFEKKQITKIGEGVFSNQKGITSVYVPKEIEEIGNSAFKNCSAMTDFEIVKDNVRLKSIGNSAFSGCSALSNIDLPSSITNIGFEAFPSTVKLGTFNGDRANINLIVVDGTKESYIANGWEGFNIVEMSATGALKVTSGQLKGSVAIPASFNDREVTQIADDGFINQTSLKSIILPTICHIGGNAFANCTELETVSYVSQSDLISVPNHATSYENYYYTERCLDVELIAGAVYTLVFEYSDLTATTEYTNVFTSLGVGENTFAVDLPVQKSFSGESGKQVIIFIPTKEQLTSSNKLWCRFIRTSTPQSVSISIKNVSLRMGVTTVSSNAFINCPKLRSSALTYRLLSDNTYAVAGVDGNWSTLEYYLSRSLFIPSVYDGKAVTQIDANAFVNDIPQRYKCRWMFIQEGVTTIGHHAFSDQTGLYNARIAASVTSIEYNAFQNCTSLDRVFFNDNSNLTTIGNSAFAGCSNLGTITLPSSVVSIGANAFQNCIEMMSIGLDSSGSLTAIGNSAFQGCSKLLAINIPNGVGTIGANTFFGCASLLYVIFGNDSNLSVIENSAFNSCSSLIDINIPAGLTYIGYDAFSGCESLGSVILSNNISTICGNAFASCSDLTIYTENNSIPNSWMSNWNPSNRPIVLGCTLSEDSSYVVSFVKAIGNPYITGVSDINNPQWKDHTFGGWYTSPDYSGTKYTSILDAPNGVLYAKWNGKACVTPGTLITLADGTQKAVEELTGDEMLLVWDMFNGTFSAAPILFIDSDPINAYEVITLTFADGTEVEVIDEHGFWNVDLNEYVFLRADAAKYIGDKFNKQTVDANGNMTYTAVELVGVSISTEYTTAWSPVTYGHLCYYVNGMLSMPGATTGLINIFEVDPDTMKIDEEAYAEDIAEYGVYTYEEFTEEIAEVPELIFNAFGGPHLKVAIGKGILTEDMILDLISRYSEFFE